MVSHLKGQRGNRQRNKFPKIDQCCQGTLLKNLLPLRLFCPTVPFWLQMIDSNLFHENRNTNIGKGFIHSLTILGNNMHLLPSTYAGR